MYCVYKLVKIGFIISSLPLDNTPSVKCRESLKAEKDTVIVITSIDENVF